MKQRFWPNFSRIIEHDKRQGKSYKGIQVLLTSFNQAISSFLQDARNRETMFSIKGYIPGDKKHSLVFFFALSSMTNLREQSIGLNKVL